MDLFDLKCSLLIHTYIFNVHLFSAAFNVLDFSKSTVKVQAKNKIITTEGENSHGANMHPDLLKWLDLVKWK